MTFLINPYQFGVSLDPDAAAFIAAVETADGQALETAVRIAYNTFFVSCKSDGMLSAIKASCILAGARTLSGALVPLVGPAPTNVNFVGSDYNRKTGLAGNGTNKYLNSNRSYTADPQNNYHLSVWISTAGSADIQMYIGGQGTDSNCVNDIFRATGLRIRNRGDSSLVFNPGATVGFVGSSRSSTPSFTGRSSSSSVSATATSVALSTSQPIYIFARNLNGTPNFVSNARLAFYSIGESLDLALLDSRITTLINALAAAIP